MNDAENDVYFTQSGMLTADKTILHDEIDIKTLSIDGQNVNLTFYGDISSWITTENITTSAIIMLLEDFDWDYFKANKSVPFPLYAILFLNWTVGYDVFFVYYDEYASILFWNGSAFISEGTDAMSIGCATQKSIVATVPLGGFKILDNSTYVANSIFAEKSGFLEKDIYTDIAPEKFNPFRESKNNILSYNILIFIGTLLGIIIILLKTLVINQYKKGITKLI